MASPKTGGQFYVETNRQAAKAIATAQGAGRRFMDEVADVSRVTLDSWASSQMAALDLAFQLQNSMIQASRMVFEAAVESNRRLFEEWARVASENEAAAMRTMAAGVSALGDSVPKGRL